MRARAVQCRVLALLVGLVAYGCMGTHTQTIEVYEPRPPEPFAKFLVVGAHADGRIRRLFENAFVGTLTRHGVEGVQSYRFLYEEQAITPANVLRAVEASGADAVLTVRVLEAEVRPKAMRPIPRERLEFDLFSTNPERQLLPRPDKVRLRTNVYQADNRHLVLSATSLVISPESVERVGQELCEETIKILTQENLLRQ